ncbi:hypothetical protein COHA_002901 [Chlorella ohadii]|uniref:Endonuclease/exonuclease/phosphatase domain-containing protein n=1 Tax=Chlorella ohadii TaxID=2649997 RepID=A0AAD5H776_9CHLO|nr:hypothetical protein COHA_002901 [Chlorella ohadii]
MLRLLTFNISGGNVSALSPPGFGLTEKYAAIVELVRRHAPHIVALQEVPESRPLAAQLADALADSTHGPPYKLAASTESHCGLCQVFVQKRLRATGGKDVGPIVLCKIPLPLPPEPDSGDGSGSSGGDAEPEAAAPAAAAGDEASEAAAGAPAVAAAANGNVESATEAAAAGGTAAGAPGAAGGGKRAYPYYLYVAGCHLEPFAEGADYRLAQINMVMREVPPRAHFVLAGDTNMRVKENAAVESRGLVDAWQQVGAPRAQAYSWNTQVNHYHGPGAHEYIARYDRIYVRGLEATSYQLVANEPLTDAGDFLSDHFGLLCELRVPPGPVASPPPNRGAATAAAAKRQRLSPSAGGAAAAGHPPARLFV